MPLRVFLAAAILAAAAPALATPQLRDLTDMWFDPAESGWGLNVIHQGDTLFATLFVYGPDGQPKWYVASSLTGGPGAYAGALSECTGAWFGGPFSAAPQECHDVGPMRFEPSGAGAVVDYTVGGVHVSKQVQRFSFRAPNIAGVYEGALIQPATSDTLAAGRHDWTLRIRDNGSTVEMDTNSDASSGCTYTGVPSYDGQLETVTGTYRCISRSGPWSMTVDPTTEGITGSFTGEVVTGGRIAAGRSAGTTRMQGLGWRNDMWFVPGESGWGFNVIEQGDTLFATLFVYDAQRRPRWYVASSLTQQGDAADGAVTYAGPLVESTGPYFGTAFNPAAVTRQEVGRMSFRARPDGVGELAYTVNGVQVGKQLQRFAFRKQDFTGQYLGAYAHDRPARITIDDTGANFRMQVDDEIGGSGTCNFVAPMSQTGSLRTMAGSFTCNGGTTGTFLMRYATVSADGFTARFDSPMYAFSSVVDGHIGGARR
jgi:hypothetical protein